MNVIVVSYETPPCRALYQTQLEDDGTDLSQVAKKYKQMHPTHRVRRVIRMHKETGVVLEDWPGTIEMESWAYPAVYEKSVWFASEEI